MWRETFQQNKWLSINEDLAYKEIINRSNAVDVTNAGKYLSAYTFDANGIISLVSCSYY
jgi:hypothetical protein